MIQALRPARHSRRLSHFQLGSVSPWVARLCRMVSSSKTDLTAANFPEFDFKSPNFIAFPPTSAFETNDEALNALKKLRDAIRTGVRSSDNVPAIRQLHHTVYRLLPETPIMRTEPLINPLLYAGTLLRQWHCVSYVLKHLTKHDLTQPGPVSRMLKGKSRLLSLAMHKAAEDGDLEAVSILGHVLETHANLAPGQSELADAFITCLGKNSDRGCDVASVLSALLHAEASGREVSSVTLQLAIAVAVKAGQPLTGLAMLRRFMPRLSSETAKALHGDATSPMNQLLDTASLAVKASCDADSALALVQTIDGIYGVSGARTGVVTFTLTQSASILACLQAAGRWSDAVQRVLPVLMRRLNNVSDLHDCFLWQYYHFAHRVQHAATTSDMLHRMLALADWLEVKHAVLPRCEQVRLLVPSLEAFIASARPQLPGEWPGAILVDTVLRLCSQAGQAGGGSEVERAWSSVAPALSLACLRVCAVGGRHDTALAIVDACLADQVPGHEDALTLALIACVRGNNEEAAGALCGLAKGEGDKDNRGLVAAMVTAMSKDRGLAMRLSEDLIHSMPSHASRVEG